MKHRNWILTVGLGVSVLLAAGFVVWLMTRPERQDERGAAEWDVRAPEVVADSSSSERAAVEVAAGEKSSEATVDLATVDANELIAKLKRREINFAQLAELPREQRDAAYLAIAKERIGAIPSDRRESVLADLMKLPTRDERAAHPYELTEHDRAALREIETQFVERMSVVAEQTLVAIDADMRLKWDRGEGVRSWRTGEAAPTDEPSEESGHFGRRSTTQLGDLSIMFSYSSASDPRIAAQLAQLAEWKAAWARERELYLESVR